MELLLIHVSYWRNSLELKDSNFFRFVKQVNALPKIKLNNFYIINK